MQHLNWLIILSTGLIPLVVGSVWYNPKVFGTVWMKASGMTEEKAQSGNMPVIFGMTLLLGIILSSMMPSLVIHQMHYYSIFMNDAGMMDPNSEISKSVQAFMDVNGSNFRSFKHGALHGTLAALFFALPVIGILGLFEGKGRNYILVHTGYWVVTLALMGGLVCAFA
jgi:Protein of unknown function (DUF1761)